MKTKLKWLGPFQIIELISENVYLISSPFGKSMRVHASRSWFYDGVDYKPSKAITALFKKEWDTLEVDDIKELRIWVDYGIEYLIAWLRLEVNDDTWEDGASINKDVLHLVNKFILKQSPAGRLLIRQSLSQTKKIDKVELLDHPGNSPMDNSLKESFHFKEKLYTNGRKSWIQKLVSNFAVAKNFSEESGIIESYRRLKKAGLGFILERDDKNIVFPSNKIERHKIRASFEEKIKTTKGWMPEELHILKLCCLKFCITIIRKS